MKKIVISLFVLLAWNSVYAQNNTKADSVSREMALNVYFSCSRCDLPYFRENFTLINYVRDRKVADVQIIVSTMETASRGTEYLMQFIGYGRFSHLNDTLTFHTKVDDTWDEIRAKQLSILKTGLVPFIMKTPYAERVLVNYKEEKIKTEENDSWNNWVFRLSGNSWLNGQKSYNSLNLWTSVSASRITEQIKHSTYFSYNYSEDNFRLYDNNDSLIYSANSIQRSFNFRHSTIVSFGEHWGVGISTATWQSTYSNIDLGLNIKPAIEYNLFEYSNASRKQLRFGYEIGALYFDYTDTTVYNKLKETVLNQKIDINFKYITNWGSIRSGAYWTNYLHDFSLYSVGTNLSMNIRIIKGLSFNISGSISMPRNQIGLVKTEVTSEDVLLRQYELKTLYSYYTSIGLSYTFGSIYNNVVNPRLD